MPKKNSNPKPKANQTQSRPNMYFDVPELIRLDSYKGYVRGNVRSVKGNTLRIIKFCQKWSVTPDELRKMARFLKAHPRHCLEKT